MANKKTEEITQKDTVIEQPAVSSLKEADKAPGVTIEDAELHDEPVRSNRPDSELLQSLAVGAGQHTPPESDLFDTDGRWIQPGLRGDVETAADVQKDPK